MSNKQRGSIYIGVTSDLQQRVWEHKNGVHSGFTSRYQLKMLIWFEQHPNIVLAIKREKRLKEYKRDWKVDLIEQLNPTWIDLCDKIYEIENIYMPAPNSRLWSDYN